MRRPIFFFFLFVFLFSTTEAENIELNIPARDRGVLSFQAGDTLKLIAWNAGQGVHASVCSNARLAKVRVDNKPERAKERKRERETQEMLVDFIVG